MEKCCYARSENAFGEKETLSHHSRRVSQLCGEFLSPVGGTKIGNVLGGLHDFGKAGERFGEVLKGKRFHVNHAYPGAALVYGLYGQKKTARILANVIAAHHSYLNYGCLPALKEVIAGTGKGYDENGNEFSLFGREEMKKAMDIFREETPELLQIKLPPLMQGEDSPLAQMLFERFLLSALADGDYSASAEHFEPDYLKTHTGPSLNPEEVLERLLSLKREKQSRSAASSELNTLRDQLFEDCLKAAELSPGLFTLTAPTGLGKTLSLFAFAVKHCMKYRQMRRIILILPYLAIAEQNVKDYRKLVPQLLESHSGAELDEEARILAERWSAPCIVTTNVGFFEPLFSARPTDCRRLHQIADSVIVLDEAQSLPPNLLESTLETVKLLCSRYGCSVVFSTATQPSFCHLPGLEWSPREIVPNPQTLFSAARRVAYDWRIENPVSYEEIGKEILKKKQCCVIVNLRDHGRKLFQLLEKEKQGEVFFLTSDLCPSHRSQVLQTVRERLEHQEPCCLVATQCIEAGVDISFPVIYRALAPLEAIIQAAGRCNRNGSGPDGHVIIFLPEEKKLYPREPYYERAADCVKTLASRHPVDCFDLGHIEEYYQLLYSNMEGDKEKLKQAIESMDYQKVQEEYKLIESKGVQVIVPWEGKLELFYAVRSEYEKTGLTKKLMEQARQITVSSFQTDKVREWCAPLRFQAKGKRGWAETGWYLLENKDCYSEKLGLNFEAMDDFDGIV